MSRIETSAAHSQSRVTGGKIHSCVNHHSEQIPVAFKNAAFNARIVTQYCITAAETISEKPIYCFNAGESSFVQLHLELEINVQRGGTVDTWILSSWPNGYSPMYRDHNVP